MTLAVIEESTICCPYCGETFTTLIDTTVDAQTCVEDCQVCCSPIVLDIYVEPDSEQVHIDFRRENE